MTEEEVKNKKKQPKYILKDKIKKRENNVKLLSKIRQLYEMVEAIIENILAFLYQTQKARITLNN